MKWAFCKITDITETEYSAIYNSLSDSRKAHIDKMKRREDRLRSLAAGHILTGLLKECGEKNFTLETLQNGKPQLAGSDWFFSLSHSHEGVVAVVSKSPIGIDIEKIKPIDDKLIDYVCNQKEKEYVLQGEADKFYRFFCVWTAKEAFFKKSNGKAPSVRAVDTTPLEKNVILKDDFVITIL
jgi:4'-phosphopantetheinyl transferase